MMRRARLESVIARHIEHNFRSPLGASEDLEFSSNSGCSLSHTRQSPMPFTVIFQNPGIYTASIVADNHSHFSCRISQLNLNARGAGMAE
jgi:hypothetical protein